MLALSFLFINSAFISLIKNTELYCTILLVKVFFIIDIAYRYGHEIVGCIIFSSGLLVTGIGQIEETVLETLKVKLTISTEFKKQC